MELESIPIQEVLRYLGAGGKDPGPLLPLAEDCARELLAAAKPRWTWRAFGCALDIAGHLAGCREVVLMAATLSPGVDALLRRSQLSDLSRGLVLESCATAAIEEVCDRGEAIIRQRYPGRALTSRYSPGYGDLPVTVQGAFLDLLDAPRRLGLCATGSSILTPRKSVTAVIGVREEGAEDPGPHRRSCDSCAMKDRCTYRKQGGRCGAAT